MEEAQEKYKQNLDEISARKESKTLRDRQMSQRSFHDTLESSRRARLIESRKLSGCPNKDLSLVSRHSRPDRHLSVAESTRALLRSHSSFNEL